MLETYIFNHLYWNGPVEHKQPHIMSWKYNIVIKNRIRNRFKGVPGGPPSKSALVVIPHHLNLPYILRDSYCWANLSSSPLVHFNDGFSFREFYDLIKALLDYLNDNYMWQVSPQTSVIYERYDSNPTPPMILTIYFMLDAVGLTCPRRPLCTSMITRMSSLENPWWP